MSYKSGDIVFLTRRTSKKPFYRWLVSNGIAAITKFKNQQARNVKVHAAIIFKKEEDLYVRDMDSKGNVPILLSEYAKEYGCRLEIVKMPLTSNPHAIRRFNREALSGHVDYDYLNTFLWQLLRGLGHKWIGWNTPYKRMCAEDVQRMYNIINPIFKEVEKTNPNELYKFIKIYNNG